MKKLLLITFSVLTYASTYAQNIKTLAGNGVEGYGGDGSAATLASFNLPEGVAVDDSGNIYIADGFNNRIRKVTASTGIISTVAGNGIAGYFGDGSLATSSRLDHPSGVAIDVSGNIYIADGYNHKIRKVTASTGIISTVAGNGTYGYGGDGSVATSANLNTPTGVAIDGSGNIYIADLLNHRIRKVTASTGIISTVAGNGTNGYGGDGSVATSANLNTRGVAVDGSGNIYIADKDNHRIRKVTASTGIISTVAGNGTNGYGGDSSAATLASLNFPEGVAVDDSGNIYIADVNNHRIRKVTALTGIISTVAGNGTAGYFGDGSLATSSRLNIPVAVAINGSGNIYIADAGNQRIRKVTISIDNNIVANSQAICTGSVPLSLTGSTPIGGTSSYSYSWLSSTINSIVGFTAIPSTNTINYSPGELTQNTWFKRYVVSGTFKDTSVAVTITVNPIPPTSDIIGKVNAAKLDTASYSVNGLSGSFFNWIVSGGTIQSGADSNKIQVKWTTTGINTIKVTETSNQGCVGVQKSLSVNVSPTIGMNELKVNNQVSIYPNPFTETIHITLLNNLKLEKAIIYDLVGNEIISSNKNEIDASSLKSGIYLIMIVDNIGNSYSEKLVKN
ncbi:MAG: T9SS type A sorting domain-containing protein [Bacteroidota bacterium]|jgi:sugar lactone lactonase YvrE